MAAGSRRPMRLRIRARDGSGPGGGRGGGGGASRTSGRGSRTVTGGAAVALATGVVRDLSDPDGLLRQRRRTVPETRPPVAGGARRTGDFRCGTSSCRRPTTRRDGRR
jgi:hypothetical protein